MIDTKQLAEWKALADAATPGPWVYLEALGAIDSCQSLDSVGVRVVEVGDADGTNDDYEFIAASREAVPALIEEVERLTAECDHYNGEWIKSAMKVHDVSVKSMIEIEKLRSENKALKVEKESLVRDIDLLRSGAMPGRLGDD